MGLKGLDLVVGLDLKESSTLIYEDRDFVEIQSVHDGRQRGSGGCACYRSCNVCWVGQGVRE